AGRQLAGLVVARPRRAIVEPADGLRLSQAITGYLNPAGYKSRLVNQRSDLQECMRAPLIEVESIPRCLGPSRCPGREPAPSGGSPKIGGPALGGPSLAAGGHHGAFPCADLIGGADLAALGMGEGSGG